MFNKNKKIDFNLTTKRDKNKPKILIVCTPFKFDGLLMHSLAMYKAHLDSGYDSKIVVPNGSDIEKKLLEQKLPFYSFVQSKILRPHRLPRLKKLVSEIVHENNIDIIICNRHKEFLLLKKIDKKVKVILIRHSPSPLRSKYIKNFKNIICVDKNCINSIKKKCRLENIPEPKMYHLAPFFDEKEVLEFSTSMDKFRFFRQEFGIELKNLPIIIMVACLRGYKNHQLMFKALHKLVYEKNKPFNLILCGDGYRKKHLQLLAKKLKIDEFIYFLGFTYKRIEAIYHSDIKALTTRDEAFGIVLMEAALLKKPLIGTKGTGMENVIKNQKTGLLFEKNNVDDLVLKIERLIENKELQKNYGENAYRFVTENLSQATLMKKIEKIYGDITA